MIGGAVAGEATQRTVGQIDEVGRVMAQLNDWRAITFVLVVVIVVLLFERYWSQREMRLERKAMMEIATQFATSAGAVAEALNSVRQEVAALRLVTARIASIASSAGHDKRDM